MLKTTANSIRLLRFTTNNVTPKFGGVIQIIDTKNFVGSSNKSYSSVIEKYNQQVSIICHKI